MDPSRANRRRQPRLRRKLPVALDLRGRAFGAVTQNLSTTGLLLHSGQMLLAGTAVTGTLIADNLEIRFTALVRWSRSGSRSSSADPHNSPGLECLPAPGRASLAFLTRGRGDDAEPRTAIEPRLAARGPPRSCSEANAGLEELEPLQHTLVERPPAFTQSPVPPPSPYSDGVTGRTNLSEEIAHLQRFEPDLTPAYATRHESPTAEARILPRFGLVPGLTGRAEGRPRSNQQRQSGLSPHALSAAATLFERAAVAAVAQALSQGTQTVALSMDLRLVPPAQVKLGGKLEALATLIEVGADRTLVFRVELREGSRVVAQGEHRRLLA